MEKFPKHTPDKNDEEFFWQGVKKAQEVARQEGFKIGQTIAHPDDTMTYALKEIKGNVAVVWLPGKEETAKEFPLDELFDPNVAKKEALSKQAEHYLIKQHPEIKN